MPLSSRGDDEVDQRRGAPAEALAQPHKRGEASAAPAQAKPAGGAGGAGGAQLVPSAAGGKAAVAPRVQIVSPHGEYQGATAPVDLEVFGTPGSTVVLYVTIYRDGKVFYDNHLAMTIGPTGESTCAGPVPIADYEHYAMHARVQNQAGVFSPLTVAEYRGWQGEIKGGGV